MPLGAQETITEAAGLWHEDAVAKKTEELKLKNLTAGKAMEILAKTAKGAVRFWLRGVSPRGSRREAPRR